MCFIYGFLPSLKNLSLVSRMGHVSEVAGTGIFPRNLLCPRNFWNVITCLFLAYSAIALVMNNWSCALNLGRRPGIAEEIGTGIHAVMGHHQHNYTPVIKGTVGRIINLHWWLWCWYQERDSWKSALPENCGFHSHYMPQNFKYIPFLWFSFICNGLIIDGLISNGKVPFESPRITCFIMYIKKIIAQNLDFCRCVATKLIRLPDASNSSQVPSMLDTASTNMGINICSRSPYFFHNVSHSDERKKYSVMQKQRIWQKFLTPSILIIPLRNLQDFPFQHHIHAMHIVEENHCFALISASSLDCHIRGQREACIMHPRSCWWYWHINRWDGQKKRQKLHNSFPFSHPEWSC